MKAAKYDDMQEKGPDSVVIVNAMTMILATFAANPYTQSAMESRPFSCISPYTNL